MNFNVYKQDMIVHMQNLIRIRSVLDTPVEKGPFGQGNKDALNYVLNLCASFGFQTKNLDGYCGYAEVGSGEEIFGIISHLDVVPEGDGWDYPPYEAKIVDHYLYGRGVWDDKGPAIINIFALKALLDNGFSPNKRIRLIFGCNEESGSLCVEHYLKKEGQISFGFTPDADFPVIYAEKDINHFQIKGKAQSKGSLKLVSFTSGVADNAVPGKAEFVLQDENSLTETINRMKNYLDKYQLKYEFLEEKQQVKGIVYGKAAHGSVPFEGINAASYAIGAIHATKIENSFIRMYAQYIGLEYNGKSLHCYASDEYGDIAVNVGIVQYQNEEFCIAINSRLPFCYDTTQQLNAIKETLKDENVVITLLGDSKGFHIDKNSDFIQGLFHNYQEVSQDKKTKPLCIAGGTYAREFKNCVGFGPSLPYAPVENMHGANERMDLNLLPILFEIYTKAIDKLGMK